MADLDVRMQEFQQAGAKLQELGDKKLVLELRRDLRTASKPAGDRILAAIADKLPKRGGLADLVRNRGRATVLLDLRRGVRVQLSNRTGVWMGPFERGVVRHPVFGHMATWVEQQVLSAGAGAEQFEREAPAIGEYAVKRLTEAVGRAL